jgi:hypothetical protein
VLRQRDSRRRSRGREVQATSRAGHRGAGRSGGNPAPRRSPALSGNPAGHGFDTLCHYPHVKCLAESNHRARDRFATFIARYPADEPAVDLQAMEPKLLQKAERGITRAEVIESKAVICSPGVNVRC